MVKNKIELWQLKQRQSQPLEVKERLSINRIQAWYEKFDGKVYVAFSGGKDSTVLLNIVRSIYPHVSAVFVDTGLEYPEIKDFVRTIDNVIWIRPKIPFHKVIQKYGYPVISKEQARFINDCQRPTPNNFITRRRRLTGINRHGIQSNSGKISKKWLPLIDAPFKISGYCCNVMKKEPMYRYEKETQAKGYIGIMAGDSYLRHQSFLRYGCNMYSSYTIKSRPIMFWMEKDIWDYIKKYDLKYSKIYDMGEKRTGCMFCMFGVHLEKDGNRFTRMKKSHPKQYDYCINKLGLGEVLDYIGVSY